MTTGNPTPESVARAALALGRELTPEQAAGLAAYLGLLESWNRKTNLVGPRAWPEMLSELVADSWHLADLLASLDLPDDCVTFDFGAGAGIPGLPLRVFWKTGRYVMIEPRAKRAGFLRQCAAMMRLSGTEVFEGRAEDVRGKADVCLSRAFQPWREFLETSRLFLRSAPGCPEGPGEQAGAGKAVQRDAAGAQPGRKSAVVVFSNEAQPEAAVPKGFGAAAVTPYPSRGKTGYFWVFAPSICSS
ncbi:MAG: 16S rRNA (guanine(527)-N(7))-methyltransferase RsmG [Acidobacteriota bacterium]